MVGKLTLRLENDMFNKSRLNFRAMNKELVKLQNIKKNSPSSFREILAGKVLHVAAGVF